MTPSVEFYIQKRYNTQYTKDQCTSQLSQHLTMSRDLPAGRSRSTAIDN